MSELLSNPAFKIYVISAVVLIFNPLILAGMTGAFRGKYKNPAAPEDAKLTGNAYTPNHAPEVDRVAAAHRNALENIPLALVAGLLYVLVGGSSTMVAGFMGVIVVFRWSHSICYLAALQPWRSLSYGLALLATMGMLVHTLILALSL